MVGDPVARLTFGPGQRPITGWFATAWHDCDPLVFRHVTQFAAGSSGDLGGAPLAQAVALEFDPIGVVDDAVEDGVGQRGIADDLVPARDRQLTGDQQRAGVVRKFADSLLEGSGFEPSVPGGDTIFGGRGGQTCPVARTGF